MLAATPSRHTAEPRTLMVAATGGHLMELERLSRRVQTAGRPLWMTFETDQSRSLLRGEEVEFVRFTAPRDYGNVLRNIPAVRRLFQRHNIVEVVSTGSAVALSVIPFARLHACPSHYIESAARSAGPSVTGRLLECVPGVERYSQYESWSSKRWAFSGSVFDEFEPFAFGPGTGGPLKVVVSVGTQAFRFDRLIDAVRNVVAPEWEITWQIGPNSYGDLEGTVVDTIEAEALAQLCLAADVVITQAGVGSALTAMEAGKHPLLAARLFSENEHVDDHQKLVAHELSTRGLATQLDLSALRRVDIEAAASRVVRRSDVVLPFALRARS